MSMICAVKAKEHCAMGEQDRGPGLTGVRESLLEKGTVELRPKGYIHRG